ncbi:MAG: hypothetical protein CMM49_01995 [Rhodospirillaceae bacterium]|nr:hypothetical protein [Rhodospirillaceae bacterium]
MNLKYRKNFFTYFSLFTLILFYLYGCISYSTNSKRLKINNKIYINDNLYLIYKGEDNEGCKFFIPYSKENKTIKVIYYITKKNKYTLNKNKAACYN